MARGDATAATRDGLDPTGVHRGSRRQIPWERAVDPGIDAAVRERIGLAWLGLMRQEHLAVGAFARMTHELAQCGVDTVVLSLIARAASDEVRHAEICRRMAARFLPKARVPDRVAGVPRVPPHPSLSVRERALLHVVEMCCFNETFTGVYLTEARARASDETARAALDSLLEDEIDHGRVGWAHVASACAEGWGHAVLAAALPSVFERAVGNVFAPLQKSREIDAAPYEACGVLSPVTSRDLHATTLRDVIVPGFETLGIDASMLRDLAQKRGWLGA